jgi:hypothetical protein
MRALERRPVVSVHHCGRSPEGARVKLEREGKQMKFGHSLAVTLLCCSFVSAQTTHEFPSTSGNAFVRLCSVVDKDDSGKTGPEVQTQMACIGYIEGLVEGTALAISYAQKVTNIKKIPMPYCLPSEVENGQIIKIVLKHIQGHPETAHEPTTFLVMVALEKSFPCGSK